jgi:tetratricopeptide (TPR) repeat protein
MRGDLAGAWRRCEDARATFRTVGDRYAEAHVLGYMAQIELERGKPEVGTRLSTEALRICRDIGSSRGEAQSLYRLAQTHLVRDQVDEAVTAFERVLQIVVAGGDLLGTAYSMCGLGEALLRQGPTTAAEATLVRALAVARRVADRFIEGRISLALGRLHLFHNRRNEAQEHVETALRLFTEIRSPLWEAEARLTNGQLVSARQPSNAE